MKGGLSTGTWNYKTAKLYGDERGIFYFSRGSRVYLTEWEWCKRVWEDARYLNMKPRVRVRAGREVVA